MKIYFMKILANEFKIIDVDAFSVNSVKNQKNLTLQKDKVNYNFE